MQNAHPKTIWLAIETSGRAGSIAVARGRAGDLPESSCVGQASVGQASCLSSSSGLLHLLAEEDLPAQRRHNVELFPVITRTFERLGLRPGELTHVAVSAGPGSFTALRIGIVAARTLAQATGAKLIAIPTFEALVWTVFSSRNPQTQPPNAQNPALEGHASVLTLSNAKRGHVFGEVWGETAIGHGCGSPPPSPLVPRPSSLVTRPSLLVTYSSLIPLAEYDLTELLARAPRPLRAAGEAVREHADVLRAAGVDVSEPVIERPTASAVLAVAADKVRTQGEAAYGDLHQLEPIYVRLAEAEEKWRAAHGTTDKHR